MATVTRYVDPGAGGAANGTSWTDAYTSLSAWQTAEATNLVSDGDEHIVYVRGAVGSSGIAIGTGWTTGASNTLTIEGNWGGGAWDDSASRMVKTSDWAWTDLAVGYITIKNMQFKNAASDSRPTLRIATGSATGIVFVNCLWADSPTTHVDIQNDGTSYFINCASYNSGGEGFYVPETGSGTTAYMYNCVALNATTHGFRVDAWRTMHCKNCYDDGDTAGFLGSTNSTFSATTCASSDGSESTTTVAMATGSGAYFTNVTAGSEDATIGESSSLASGGTDLSADGTYAFDYDWEGETRSDWSIGPDEISVASYTLPHYIYGDGA